MQYAEPGTNTNLPSNRFTQTQRQNQISTHNDSCKYEEEEMDHQGIQNRSNFARQLQQSEVIPKYYNQQPATNYNSHIERPNISQTESWTIYHIPQESIAHAQQPSLQYSQQPVTNYNSDRPRQTESSTI